MEISKHHTKGKSQTKKSVFRSTVKAVPNHLKYLIFPEGQADELQVRYSLESSGQLLIARHFCMKALGASSEPGGAVPQGRGEEVDLHHCCCINNCCDPELSHHPGQCLWGTYRLFLQGCNPFSIWAFRNCRLYEVSLGLGQESQGSRHPLQVSEFGSTYMPEPILESIKGANFLEFFFEPATEQEQPNPSPSPPKHRVI